jgi:hypothetical protein
MYIPLIAFTYLSLPFIIIGIATWIRFIYFVFRGSAGGHVQSLIFGCTLIIIGFLVFVIGVLADTISSNRRILQDVQYHVKRLEYELTGSSGADDRAGAGVCDDMEKATDERCEEDIREAI